MLPPPQDGGLSGNPSLFVDSSVLASVVEGFSNLSFTGGQALLSESYVFPAIESRIDDGFQVFVQDGSGAPYWAPAHVCLEALDSFLKKNIPSITVL